jgi:hypothetical protein
MKAEHRKELQTNALADRMGRVIQGMKKRPSRGSFLTVVLVIFVVLAVAFFLWRRSSANQRESDRWVDFSRTQEERSLDYVMNKYPDTIQSRLAEIQLAWIELYEGGIKMLGIDANRATQNIAKAKAKYQRILAEVKDDPVLAPEARYALAVAEESLAVEDARTHLSAAKDLYSAVAKDYPKSAHAKEAEKRAKQLANPEERERIESFYNALGVRIVGNQNQIFSEERIQEMLRKMKLKEK